MSNHFLLYIINFILKLWEKQNKINFIRIIFYETIFPNVKVCSNIHLYNKQVVTPRHYILKVKKLIVHKSNGFFHLSWEDLVFCTVPLAVDTKEQTQEVTYFLLVDICCFFSVWKCLHVFGAFVLTFLWKPPVTYLKALLLWEEGKHKIQVG